MSKIKKLLALTLALAMVLSVSAFAGSYKADSYVDAAAIDANCESAVELMYALEIMKGDDKGQFRPNDTITRAEMAKMIYVILNYGEDDKAATYTGAKFFDDVEAGYWAEGYINYCAATKLIAGRGDGKFDPTAPVTCAEAAKMLLTAIGYNAEHRGYTGATWAQNVMYDAAVLGLLDGYKYNTNLVAPRQWVAVMVANALDCLTFGTMAPGFSGLLTSGYDVGTYPTMGQKYYGYETYTGYVVYANGYAIDTYKLESGVDVDDYDFVLDIGKVDVALEGDVSIEDLGQQFKVITIDGEVVSMRNTGKTVVAEDEVKDVTSELTYSTSANNEKNIYKFTVGEFAGKINGGKANSTVNVLTVVAGADEYEAMDAADLKAEIKKAGIRNDVVRAIDKDGDGDLDYVIYTPVEYATVTKVGTSQKYGDYIKAEDMDGEALEINGNATLYIDSCIITEEELVVDNFVKFTWNIDEEMYNVEVLPVVEAAEFESRKINKDQYTFEGETYAPAANGYKTLADDLKAAGVLGDDYDIVVDGDLLVYIVETKTYTNLDAINEKLAVIIKTDIRNVDDENTKQVKLLTIDGEIAWYTYNVNTASKKNSDTVLTWTEIKGVEDEDGKVTCDEWDQLVIVYTNDDGEVYLEKVVEGDLAIDKNHDVVDYVDIDEATLDADGTPTLGKSYRVAGDNKFFAYIDKAYTVITVNELEEGEYEGVEFTALVEDGKYYDTVLGGYLKIGDASVSEDGYLFVIDTDEREDADDGYIVVLMQATGEEIELAVSEIENVEELEENVCYFYEFDGETYTMTAVAEDEDFKTLIVEEADELYVQTGEDEYKSIDATDYDFIAIVTEENLREQEDTKWEVIDIVPEFIDAETLAEMLDETLNMIEEDDYTYSFDYYFAEYEDANEDDTLWVVIVKNMIDNATEDAE